MEPRSEAVSLTISQKVVLDVTFYKEDFDSEEEWQKFLEEVWQDNDKAYNELLENWEPDSDADTLLDSDSPVDVKFSYPEKDEDEPEQT